MDHVGLKRFTNFYGLDLRSSDLTRPDQFASEIKNADILKTGSLAKRKGYQGHAPSQGGFGLFCYNRINPTSGAQDPRLVSVRQTGYVYAAATLTVTYVGASTSALISVFFDTTTDQYRCLVSEGGNTSLDQALGIGFDESSPYTIDQLRIAIDALASFTATVSGTTSTPAAFLKIVRDFDLTAGAYSGLAGNWTTINTTVTNPLSGSETNKTAADFENVSATQISNVLYLANGYDFVQKYDGQTLYRAGLPTPASVTSALGGAGAITGSNYGYRIAYVQVDAAGNTIEGNTLDTTTGLAPAAQSINVTAANVQAGTGFNTNCALVNGNQVGVTTITVTNSPHTLKVGDTAYFLDRTGTSYVERSVTAVTGTTVTISGAVVNVNNGDVISNNLRIAIFRSKTSGSFPPVTFYLVAEIPNNSFAATQVFNDNTTDANLGAQFIDHATDRSAPPKAKYVSNFNGLMLLSGQIGNNDDVFFSDIESPEYHPVGVNSFTVDTVSGDKVTGIAPNNEVFVVFKRQSIHVVSGDLPNYNFRVDQISTDIGCVAHASIQECRGATVFLTDRGPYVVEGGRVPIPLGNNRIEPVFDQDGVADNVRLRLEKAVAINNREQEKYILFIPATSSSGGEAYGNTFSRTFVYNYTRDAFLEWSNINMMGGAAVCNGEFYWSERTLHSFTGTIDRILYKMHNLGDAWDYQDNTTFVDFKYASHWEALGEPSLLKRFLRLRTYSQEEIRNNSFNLTIKTEINYTKDVPHSELTATSTGGIGGYGTSQYGVDPYGDPSEAADKDKLRPGRTRSMRVIFYNTNEQENSIITGWEIEAAAPFRFGMKK